LECENIIVLICEPCEFAPKCEDIVAPTYGPTCKLPPKREAIVVALDYETNL